MKFGGAESLLDQFAQMAAAGRVEPTPGLGRSQETCHSSRSCASN